MLTRRELALAGAGTALVLASAASAQERPANGPRFGPPLPDHVRGGTAISQVFGDGQRFVAIAVGYDQEIDTSKLATATFSVKGRTVERVYANNAAALSDAETNGRFVIIELSPDDESAKLLVNTGDWRTLEHRKPTADVVQVGPVTTTAGATYAANPTAIPITSVVNLIVDDFDQRVFSDPVTGNVVEYNLFVPTNYDPGRAYPLVLFMHDAGVTNTAVDTTLVQGLGAVVWASPEEQAKHESFVLAPQFPLEVATDNGGGSAWVETVVHLLEHVSAQYSIDQSRLYTTGQSGGAMVSLATMIKYPDLFAASYIVAGQWDPLKVAPLARTRQWIVVAEGDTRAYPTQNQMTAVYEQNGTQVSRSMWSGLSRPDEFTALVSAVTSENNPINYTVLRKGTVVPAGQDDTSVANHLNTWRIAYSIEGIRDWLFAQTGT